MKSRTDADEIRLRYLYRKMILMGKAKVSFETARRLVGPDCAYHLYGTMSGRRRTSNKKAGRKDSDRT
jgi:hypothetical protein